jgi:anti-anti-sigma regulatory factor
MAGNFNISINNSGDHVRLKLNGDFDGSSACELVNLLNSGGLSNTSKVLVDTDSLKHIHPFGVDVLLNRLHILKSKTPPLIFTGKMSMQFGHRHEEYG